MPLVLTYRKMAHPRNSEEPQGYEPTVVADTLNIFDNSENRTPILILEMEDKVVIPMEGNGQRPSHLGDGYGKAGDPSFTLNAVEHHGVAICGMHGDVAGTLDASYYKGCGERNGIERDVVLVEMTSTKNTIVEDGISPTLTARMGTGGNQVNAVLHDWVGVGGDVANTIDSNYFKGPGNNWSPREVVTAVDCRNSTESEDVNGALQADSYKNLNSNSVCRVGSAVRRLTPRECERLQGFPDDWTDIGNWTDSKGKKHKPSDSTRYKAIGNSLALPFWDWLLGNISDTYKGRNERPTLGSLFDGIGGFPLCWERHNGKGSAVWASEIDEFCIAVTKERFGEEA